jgi:thioredoxin 1
MSQIIYFSTPTCGPCKMFKPVVQQVAAELEVSIKYVDASIDSITAQQYSITAVPTIIVENNGSVVYRNSGVMSKPQLTQVLSQFK